MIVYDPPNHVTGTLQLQQQITSATQNVASVLKQVDQYAEQVRQYQTQLQQYAQQLKDAALPVTQVWSQAQKTMGDMMGLVNQAQNGQMLAYLQQYKDLNGWMQVTAVIIIRMRFSRVTRCKRAPMIPRYRWPRHSARRSSTMHSISRRCKARRAAPMAPINC